MKILQGLLATWLLSPMTGNTATTEISDLVIADVTDRSLSVIFTLSESAQPGLVIYTDQGATVPAMDIEIVEYPVHTGDPEISGQFRSHSIASVVSEAKSRLIVKLDARGLEPDTTYYLRPSAVSESSAEETICPDAGIDFCGDMDSFQLTVGTGVSGLHTELDSESGISQPYLNDQVIVNTSSGNKGDLAIISVEGSRYPLSAFVGDGVQAPLAVIDLNNLFSESENKLLRVTGSMPDPQRGDFGEAVILRLYQGTDGKSTLYRGIGPGSGKGELVYLNNSALGDCDLSGSVNSYDQLLLDWVVENNPLAELQKKIAFHPALCDLYKEGGIDNLSMSPEINEEDLARLKELLVGIKVEDELPEEPTP
ncbi:hypothetical protein ACJJI3_19605 [Microbulbifer sp. ZKSA004]|uniref:hypothetical protein n=1 Tax=Microbulbifer sp. ZKSA004 TaxID=3243389 RepID=UPI00403A025A